jgi:hypothetical protein
MSLFPIGDLHIESMKQARIFSGYLNSRREDFIVLLGDIIDFTNSLWNVSEKLPIEERIKKMPKDIAIWQTFLKRLTKRTIHYFGTHEMFGFPIALKMYPDTKLKVNNPNVYVPHNFEAIPLGKGKDKTFVTGISIPANLAGDKKSSKFIERKKQIDNWITKQTESLKVERPEETVLCTH